MIKKIISISNQYIKKLKKINANDEYFIVEGINLINLALEKKCVKDIILTQKYLDKYSYFESLVLTNENIIKSISSLENPPNIIAVCYKKKFHISKNQKILILDDIQDPGNLGTLIRSAVSFGIDKVILSLNSVSCFNPKVIRASQGAIFYCEIIKEDIEKVIIKLKQEKYIIYTTFLNIENKINLLSVKKTKKFVLVLGNEPKGINDKYKKYSENNIKINTNNFNSLNVAIAGAIIMYFLSL